MVDIPVPHSDGHFINERVSRIVELIREYDPYLEVAWIPPDKRGEGEAAFAIIEDRPGALRQVAFFVQTEAEFDERVLARIYAGDLSKVDVLKMLDSQNEAARQIARKKAEDEMEDMLDHAKSVVNSKLHTYRGKNGRVYQ